MFEITVVATLICDSCGARLNVNRGTTQAAISSIKARGWQIGSPDKLKFALCPDCVQKEGYRE